ncbi:hypothetical protein F4779DRAFT_272985 [Xylariaceae sp. FL0662B]|nr:hypothetical protein F4779DRAFT_272985 [Xylariaceae sp. FL0662B]
MVHHTVTWLQEDATDFQQLWQYPAQRKAGAFRAVKLDGLLRGYPRVLELVEWPGIMYPLTGAGGSNTLQSVRYAAVSHVWQYAFDVGQQVQNLPPGDQLDVAVMTQGQPDRKKLSWAGLRQLAQGIDALNNRGPHKKKVKYFWLDFLCLDQIERPNDDEKTLQLCIMGDIYENARRVVVMIGGMGAVLGADRQTLWMDRSWTLQEAVINADTWVYVTWPPTEPTSIAKPSNVGTGNFELVWADPTNIGGDCLIPLADLLDIADYNLTTTRIRVLDGTIHRGGPIARHALRAALCRDRRFKNIKYTGIWRSMFMRTSEHPIDVVYSVMGLFGLQIDPYRKNRQATYLFNDLARKAAASTINRYIGSPCWLTLGRIAGRNFAWYIPRDPESKLIPQFPDIKKNQPPTYHNGRSVVDMIDDSGNFIKTFDIKLITHSHPHIVNALMFPLRKNDVDVKGGKLTLRKKTKRCHFQDFYGDLKKRKGHGVWAIYVGVVGDMSSGKITWPPGSSRKAKLRTRLYAGGCYLLFMEYRHGKWKLIGNGIFTDNTWSRPRKRYIITVGEYAQQRRKLWVEDMADRDARVNPFRYHSYGIIPLPNYPTPDTKRIKWFGYKGSHVPSQPTTWRRLNFDFDIMPLLSYPDSLRDQILSVPKPLYVITALTSTPPASNQEYTRHKLRERGKMYVRFSWGGWSVKQCQMLALDGVEGVILPYGETRATYWARLRFGKCMIYVELKQTKKMLPQYYQVYVVPYGGGKPGKILNVNFIGSPPRAPFGSCAPLAELGLPPDASNRQVGEAIARVLVREFGLPSDQARYKAMLMWGTNLSGLADVRAWELRKRYCFRGLPPGHYYGIDPYAMI